MHTSILGDAPHLTSLTSLPKVSSDRRTDIQARAISKLTIAGSDRPASTLCLGTMQYGEAIDGAQARLQLHQAAELGINFFDTAEMYPVPQRESTQGSSEEIIGRWLKTARRDNQILCTKVTGPSGQMTYLRGGPVTLDNCAIKEAIDDSLRRLQTDYIDLYLLHWPDRYVPMFGEVEYNPDGGYSSVPLEEQFNALVDAQKAGKILQFGLSNETAWGLMRFCEIDQIGRQFYKKWTAVNRDLGEKYFKIPAYQFPYEECCHNENVSLLAYSPLAMGLLTGKYRSGSRRDPTARLNKYKGRYAEAESRYGPKPNVYEAVEAYCSLAEQAGIPPYELALRFNLSRPLISSTIIGATSSLQLSQLSAAADKGPLPEDLLRAINRIHQQYPNPTP